MQEFVFPIAELTDNLLQPNEENAPVPFDVTDAASLGKWCVVRYRYDGRFYPGKLTDVDEEDIEVNSMSAVGNNRVFF